MSLATATRPTPANPRWTLRLLGGFDLLGPGGRVEVPPGGRRLLAYLAVQGHPVARSTAAAAIWPDVDEAHGRANLRSTLCRLGALAPVVDSTTTSLAIGTAVDVDLDGLQPGPGTSAGEAAGEGREPASAAYDGELLPGWDEEWVELERERVRQLALHRLDAVVRASIAERRHGDGVDAALRAIRLDPWRESSHAGLLRALLAGGNRAAALAHFRRFSSQMRHELGLSPSRELVAVVDELLPPRPVRPVARH